MWSGGNNKNDIIDKDQSQALYSMPAMNLL